MDIRIDLVQLRSGAAEIDGAAEAVNAAATEAGKAALGGRIDLRYASQLAPKVEGYGVELLTQATSIISDLRAHATWLQDLAQRFEEADQAAVAGMDSLWATSRVLLAEYGESPFVPRWLLDGASPPWVDSELWRHLPDRDRETIIEGLRRDYANFMAGRTIGSFRAAEVNPGYLEEMFMIYLFGIPAGYFAECTVTDRYGRKVTIAEQTEAYLPEYDLFGKPMLPDGDAEYGYSHWQYQNLPMMMDKAQELGYIQASIDETAWQGWSRRHNNLCGEDAVGHAVGVEHMAHSYLAMAEVWEPPLIENSTTSPYHVAKLYEQLGWEAQIVGPFLGSELHWDEWTGEYPHVHVVPGMEEVNGYLREGYAVTALVGVDSGDAASLSFDQTAKGHYVNILETFTTRDGEGVVRVYNPLEHREEIYTWEHFEATWGKWESVDDNGVGQAVIARPGEGD